MIDTAIDRLADLLYPPLAIPNLEADAGRALKE